VDSGDVGANVARLDNLEEDSDDGSDDEDSADEDSDEPDGQGVCPAAVPPGTANRRRAAV
jgi:hypothetical protein